MFINFLMTFIHVCNELFQWLILIHVILSWVAYGQTYFGELLNQMINPILKPFRWARIGRLDFSPIVALVLVRYISYELLIPFLEQFR